MIDSSWMIDWWGESAPPITKRLSSIVSSQKIPPSSHPKTLLHIYLLLVDVKWRSSLSLPYERYFLLFGVNCINPYTQYSSPSLISDRWKIHWKITFHQREHKNLRALVDPDCHHHASSWSYPDRHGLICFLFLALSHSMTGTRAWKMKTGNGRHFCKRMTLVEKSNDKSPVSQSWNSLTKKSGTILHSCHPHPWKPQVSPSSSTRQFRGGCGCCQKGPKKSLACIWSIENWFQFFHACLFKKRMEARLGGDRKWSSFLFPLGWWIPKQFHLCQGCSDKWREISWALHQLDCETSVALSELWSMRQLDCGKTVTLSWLLWNNMGTIFRSSMRQLDWRVTVTQSWLLWETSRGGSHFVRLEPPLHCDT